MSERLQPWVAAIAAAGGQVTEEPGGPLVTALIDGCRIDVGITDAAAQAVVWLSADAPNSTGLRLAVSSSESYPFREAFAIASGDDVFDDAFSIKTNDAPVARL